MRRPRAIRIALMVVIVVAVALTVSRDQLEPWEEVYARAVAAADRDDWVNAWAGFREVLAVDEDYRDTSVRATGAARHLAQHHDLTLDVTTDLIRWLAERGEPAILATLVDRSMVHVPAGWGWMGSEGRHEQERPQRRVYIDAFLIDRYEVTNAQYEQFLTETGEVSPAYWTASEYPESQADHPVLGVSWRQADVYCSWAGKRLPSEAEWERACRGVNGREYPWGSEWSPGLANVGVYPMLDLDDAWPLLAANRPLGEAFPAPVGTHPEGASINGVVDLVGNASEWVADWYDPAAYHRLPDENPVGNRPPWQHAVRGSGWIVPFSAPDYPADSSRCAFRNASHSYDDPRVGFRCAVSGE